VWAVAVSPDARLLASASRDTVKLWDSVTGREVRTLGSHASIVSSVAFTADGRWLASGSYDNTIKLWDVATGQERRTLSRRIPAREAAGWFIFAVALSPDGRLLASAGFDYRIRLWDLATGQQFAPC
jgi:WD40 repeat protein